MLLLGALFGFVFFTGVELGHRKRRLADEWSTVQYM